MGIIRGGVLGGFRNKTGAVVGSAWNGRDVIKGLPKPSSKEPTQAQTEQKAKFGLIIALLKKAGSLIRNGWTSGENVTPMNKAMAYHLKEAITGTWPSFTVDMTKFKFSTGSQELPDNATAELGTGTKINIEWDRTTDIDDYIKPTDQLTVVAYNVEKERFVKKVAATTRATGEYELELPETFEGDTVHLYISFSSVLKNNNSDSIYLGALTLPASL